jgi:calcium/calmodulin-dependent protein kinase I
LQLGEGGFSSVFQAKHKLTKEMYAVKDVNLDKLEDVARTGLQDEISALKLLLGGPHIVRLIDVFEEKSRVYMVMEEMKGGELLQRIVEKEVYTEREARQTCKVLFEAIDYIHNKRIAHRDIKPENLLLVVSSSGHTRRNIVLVLTGLCCFCRQNKNDDTSIKIADFGFAKKVTKKKCLSTLCGTAAYVAPEVLDLKAKGYDERADMWSIGVVVYILLGGYAPFEGPIEELAVTILKGDYEFHDDYWSHISSEAKDLIALQCDWMMAEEETLTVNDLSIAQKQIKKALPVEKLRGVVKAIIATNKITSLGETFTSSLVGGPSLRRSVHGQVLEMSIAQFEEEDMLGLGSIEGSTSGKPFLELYELGDSLGAGNFSTIHNGKHKQSEIEYAIKCIGRRDLHPSDAVALQDEITALKILKDCRFIVTLHDVFEEPNTTYVVLERMRGGDLIDRIIEKAHYTENDAKEVCKNLLEAVKYCHARKIANRNLKPENLLLVVSLKCAHES